MSKRTICKVSMTQPQLDEFFRKLRERRDSAEQCAERCETALREWYKAQSRLGKNTNQKERVKSALNGHPMNLDEIATVAGVSNKQAMLALTKLMRANQAKKVGDRRAYRYLSA